MSNKILSLMGYDMPEDDVKYTGRWKSESDVVEVFLYAKMIDQDIHGVIVDDISYPVTKRYIRARTDGVIEHSDNQIDWEEVKPEIGQNGEE